jgi:hypothetical protein
MVCRVTKVLLLGNERMPEWNSADRWRLVCSAGCKGDFSSGSMRTYWALAARKVAAGEREPRELPAPYQSSFDDCFAQECRFLERGQ